MTSSLMRSRMSAAPKPSKALASRPGKDSSICFTVNAQERAVCSTSAEARTDRLIRAFSSRSFRSFSALMASVACPTWFCITR